MRLTTSGTVPFRFVPRGKERFPDNVDEIWKKNHPGQVSEQGQPGWSCWAGLSRRATGSDTCDMSGSIKGKAAEVVPAE